MSTKNVAPEVPELVVGEECTGAFSFKGKLESGELLTGTPLVEEINTSALTLGNKAVNTSPIQVGSDTNVLAGQAVQYSVSGHQAGQTYKLKFTANTNATPAQKRIYYGYIKGVQP